MNLYRCILRAVNKGFHCRISGICSNRCSWHCCRHSHCRSHYDRSDFFRLLNINDLLLCFIKFSRYGTIVLYKAPKLVCFINLWLWSVSTFHKTSSFLTASSQSHIICKIGFLKGRWRKESNSFLR